jgi:Flp pilus assembly protein TadG
MRWLRDDRGATAVMTAMIMTALLGIVGLVIDGGALYLERRELRNAADAAALAVAEDCAVGSLPCQPAIANSTAAAYANENSRDGASAVADLSLDPAGRTVTVDVATRNPDGTTKVQPFFGQVVGWTGMTVHASATAVWGYPRVARSMLPLIVSECEFALGTPVPTPPRTLYFHDGNNAEPCNAVAGQDTDGDGKLAGGFGWLSSDSTCDGMFTADTWHTTDPGSSPPSVCSPPYVGDLVGEEIVLPIFDDLEMVGAGGRYHIAGFGLFHVTGYNFGGLFKAPSISGAPCQGDERCISGYFTDGVVYEGETGGSNWGFVIVKLTG